MNECITDS